MKGSILVVDDDREMCQLLEDLLSEEGYRVESLQDGETALQMLELHQYDLLITDLRMHGISGLELLQRAKVIEAKQAIIIITAFGTVETAIESMKLGAADYIIKPFKRDHLLIVVAKAFDQIRLHKEVTRLRQVLTKSFQFSNMIGKSKAMQSIFQLIQRVSESTVNVAITGESGTGKEVVAKAIHFNSPRKNQPFVAVDCASIPETLLESELFGYVRGAFTDARNDKMGMFEEAHRGTLFLDEIGEIPLSLQPKLLRAIQEKTIRRVGSTRTTAIDIRIISASNRDLFEGVKEKKFRDDLYYRLNVLQIDLPPLRKRREDIPLLANFFLKKYLLEQTKSKAGFSEAALEILLGYPWPGNVRELENAIERAVTLSQGDTINADDFPPVMTGRHGDQVVMDQALTKLAPLAVLEREYVWRVLQLVHGNKMKAAQLLQIDRKTLYRKLKEYREEQHEIIPAI
ncbi:MAG: sigma-54-dependent transcriptional regulator [Nitrospiria bacterium]